MTVESVPGGGASRGDISGGGAPRGAARPSGLRIGRILGFDLRVNFAWVFVLGIIGYLAIISSELVSPPFATDVTWVIGVATAIGFFVTSVIHDLAHAIVARRRGLPVTSILITAFGGTSVVEPQAASAKADLAIAAAGPLASLMIGLVLGLVTRVLDGIATPGSPIAAAEAVTALVTGLSFIVGLVNLVPAYPLDGGRIIRAIGWWRTGSLERGWRAAARAGRIAGYSAIGAGLIIAATSEVSDGLVIGVGGWFLILSARGINERARVNRLIGGLHVRDAMETSTISVGPNLTVDTFAGQLLGEEADTTAVPVVEEGDVVGVLGARQLQQLQRRLWPTTHVGDVMAKPPRLILLSALDSLEEAVERLYRTGLDGLPVVDDGALVGILTRRSVAKLVHDRGEGLPARS